MGLHKQKETTRIPETYTPDTLAAKIAAVKKQPEGQVIFSSEDGDRLRIGSAVADLFTTRRYIDAALMDADSSFEVVSSEPVGEPNADGVQRMVEQIGVDGMRVALDMRVRTAQGAGPQINSLQVVTGPAPAVTTVGA